MSCSQLPEKLGRKGRIIPVDLSAFGGANQMTRRGLWNAIAGAVAATILPVSMRRPPTAAEWADEIMARFIGPLQPVKMLDDDQWATLFQQKFMERGSAYTLKWCKERNAGLSITGCRPPATSRNASI